MDAHQVTDMGQESSQIKSTPRQHLEKTQKASSKDTALSDQPDESITEKYQRPGPNASAKVDSNVVPMAKTRSLKKKHSNAHKTTKTNTNSKTALRVTSTSTIEQDNIAASSQVAQEASTSAFESRPSASTLERDAKIYDGYSKTASNDLDPLSSISRSEVESLASERLSASPSESLFVAEDAPTLKAPRPKRRMPNVTDDVPFPAQPQVKKPKTSRKLGANRREDHRSVEDIEKHGGVFTHEEVAMFEAWRDGSCNVFDLTKDELRDCLLQKSHKHNKDLHGLYEDLYSHFPNRKQDAVRKFARRQVSEKRGAKWKPHEDETIQSMMAQVPRPTYQQIGHELGRFEEDVRNRWRDKLAPGAVDASKGTWQFSEVQALYRAHARCLLKAGAVSWPQIASDVGSRSRVQCTQKWKALERMHDHAKNLRKARVYVKVENEEDDDDDDG